MNAVIFDAVRTPRARGITASDGRPAGTLSEFLPHELVAQLAAALDERNRGHVKDHVSGLLLGCVGQVGSQGGNIALVSKHAAKLPARCQATTLNNYCAGGLTAVNYAAAWSGAKPTELLLAGGIEMLSRVPVLADRADYYTDPAVRDSLEWLPAPLGSELMAALDGYSREALDAVSVRSHKRAAAAWDNGRFTRGVVPVRRQNGELVLERDEWVRPDSTMETLAALPLLFADEKYRPARETILRHFPEAGDFACTHTVAHVPGLSDGAALVLLGHRDVGERLGLRARARIVGMAEVGGDKILQFGAGFAAMEQALSDARLALDELDLIEFMEAFAAPPLRFERQYDVDMDKVNVNGGHLAMGHPMGATGAVLIGSLLDELERRDGSTGMAVALGANGIGSAIVIERCH